VDVLPNLSQDLSITARYPLIFYNDVNSSLVRNTSLRVSSSFLGLLASVYSRLLVGEANHDGNTVVFVNHNVKDYC
jgi:hypothetical protein